MSLKAFHYFFIVASIILCAGIGYWGVADFQANGDPMSRVMGIGSFVCTALLLAYGVYAVRKYKNLSYL